MLQQRALTAAIGVPILVALIYLGGWWLFICFSALVLLGMWEVYAALPRRDIRPRWEVGMAAGFLILWAVQFTKGTQQWELIGLALALATALSLVLMFWKQDSSSATGNVTATVFVVVYVAFLFSYFLRLRYLPLHYVEGIPEGGFRERCGLMLMVIGAVWSMDTGAYLVGNRFGTAKPWPQISPGKTWEGCVGGWMTCVVVTMVLAWVLQLRLPSLLVLAIGAGMGIVGQVADFSKSVIKRDLGIKDFGSVFPGHGGVMDRFDSLQFAIPLVYWIMSLYLAALPHK